MMTEEQHLLVKIGEEAGEVEERALKASIFGIAEVQPGQSLTNAARMEDEFVDLIAVMIMAHERGLCAHPVVLFRRTEQIAAKIAKVRRFMEYSRKQGMLEPCP